ncbi:hypothetical protein ACP70R_047962 [Stipagrostis hirtigluma subsp. patula]
MEPMCGDDDASRRELEMKQEEMRRIQREENPGPVARVLDLGFRFTPSPLQAAAYYLPRLVAGEPLHDALRTVIHRADVYACEPGVLAAGFRPAPKTDDRFFFTSVRMQPQRAGKAGRAARAAGGGAWSSQKAIDILDAAGAKVGELTKLRYKKRGGENTDWLMDEYSCCSEDAVAGDVKRVLCKIYVSPRAAADSAAHQESAAVFAAPPAPVVVTQPAPKRPAPPVAVPPCAKKMRVAAVPAPPVVQPSGCPMPVAPPRPCCVPRRGVAPSSTPPVARTPTPALPQARVQTRPAAQPGRSPAPATPWPAPQKVPLPPPSAARACNMPQQAASSRLCPPRPAVMAPPVAQAPPTPRPSPAAAPLPVPAASPDLPSKEAPAAADDDMDELVKLIEDAIPTGEADVDEQVHKERDPFAAAMAWGAKHMCAY